MHRFMKRTALTGWLSSAQDAFGCGDSGVLADLTGAVHFQDDLVGKPVGEKVHGGGQKESENHAGLATDCAPHEDHEDGEE